MGVLHDRGHDVEGLGDGAPAAAVAGDAIGVAERLAPRVVQRRVRRRVPLVPAAEVEPDLLAGLVHGVAELGVVGEGDAVVLRAAARVDLEPARAGVDHPLRVGRLVPVGAGAVVGARAALAGAAAAVEAVDHLLLAAGVRGLRRDPVAERLHPLRELDEVLVCRRQRAAVSAAAVGKRAVGSSSSSNSRQGGDAQIVLLPA